MARDARAKPVNTKKLTTAFGENVREMRRSKGLSQEALAASTGLHRTYVGSVERGERNPSLVNIARLARALGVTPSDLLHDVGGR